MKSLTGALLFAVLFSGHAGASDVPQVGDKRLYRSKPSAPIDVRWVSDGADGRVLVDMTSGLDHVGATLSLFVQGRGAPLVANLPSAAAGEIQAVSWSLNRPAVRPLRLSIRLDTGDAVVTRQVVAPRPAGKPRRDGARPASVSDGSRASEFAGQSAEADERRELLIRLPAAVTIRKAGD
jgi:hypothetical protein